MHHTSFTQIQMMQRCGEQYRRRYPGGEKLPPAAAMVVGMAPDRVASKNLKAKIDGAMLLTADESEEAGRTEARNIIVTEGLWLSQEERKEGEKKVADNAVARAGKMARAHTTSLLPVIQPTHVQREWAVVVPAYDTTLIGVIDVQEGARSVRDLKCSKRAPTKYAAENSDQLTAYALAALTLDGMIPEELILDVLTDGTKGVHVHKRIATRDRDDLQSFYRRLERHIEAVEKGVFVPTSQDNWQCSLRWCGYAPTCPYFRGHKVLGTGVEL